MSFLLPRLALALVSTALWFGAAHAQSAPVGYWLPNWPLGFGGSLSAAAGAERYGNFPSFNGSDASGAYGTTRYNFSNGWFVGSERTNLGFNGFSQDSTFGGYHTEGVQFGYNFKNTSMPITVFGGLDTLKYNSGLGGNPFAPFDNQSGTAGYSAHAGVEFKPTSNLSLSFGASFSQQSGGDINSAALPGSTWPLAVRR
jgi:opacity protein-like surface antigen